MLLHVSGSDTILEPYLSVVVSVSSSFSQSLNMASIFAFCLTSLAFCLKKSGSV